MQGAVFPEIAPGVAGMALIVTWTLSFFTAFTLSCTVQVYQVLTVGDATGLDWEELNPAGLDVQV